MADSKSQSKFFVGDLVFAKIKGYPPWPAAVIECKPKRMYKVRFFDSGQTSIVNFGDLFRYAEHREEFATEKNMRRKDFRIAMELIDAENSFNAGMELMDGEDDHGSWHTVSPFEEVEIRAASPARYLQEDDAMGAEQPVAKVATEGFLPHKPPAGIEERFMLLCSAIRACLNVNRTDVMGCLRLFKQLKKLDLTKEMLLRNPDCLNIVRRSRGYAGNVKHWNFNANQKAKFKKRARMIRREAKLAYEKFQNIFDCVGHEQLTFFDTYNSLVMSYKKPKETTIIKRKTPSDSENAVNAKEDTVVPPCHKPIESTSKERETIPDLANNVQDKDDRVMTRPQLKKKIKRISDEKYILLYGFMRY